MEQSFTISGITIPLRTRRFIEVPVAKLFTHTPLTMPVQVINGIKPGPVLFVCAATHGDEINGVEIIRRVTKKIDPEFLTGTLVAVPVVNVYGFQGKSRYLPDRRDLNRCFPGSETGSLASRLAHIFMKVIVDKCTHGIDLHTGAIHRSNFPQIRANLKDPATNEFAHAFGAPVILHGELIEGSLRACVTEKEMPMLLFEGGEALRFDEFVIRAGVRGVLKCMEHLKMMKSPASEEEKNIPFVAYSSKWIRASQSGIFRATKKPGDSVNKGEIVGYVADPFGDNEKTIESPLSGLIIGGIMIPLVDNGDALFHVASFEELQSVAESVRGYQSIIASEGSAPDPEVPNI